MVFFLACKVPMSLNDSKVIDLKNYYLCANEVDAW